MELEIKVKDFLPIRKTFTTNILVAKNNTSNLYSLNDGQSHTTISKLHGEIVAEMVFALESRLVVGKILVYPHYVSVYPDPRFTSAKSWDDHIDSIIVKAFTKLHSEFHGLKSLEENTQGKILMILIGQLPIPEIIKILDVQEKFAKSEAKTVSVKVYPNTRRRGYITNFHLSDLDKFTEISYPITDDDKKKLDSISTKAADLSRKILSMPGVIRVDIGPREITVEIGNFPKDLDTEKVFLVVENLTFGSFREVYGQDITFINPARSEPLGYSERPEVLEEMRKRSDKGPTHSNLHMEGRNIVNRD